VRFHAKVHVTLKPVVNDPEGLVIRDALRNLGFGEVESVRSGKYLQLHLDADSENEATSQVEEMCAKLLANPVIEDFEFDVRQAPIAAR
jgi:phosphoribosylformylglycinamidine synthase